MSIPDYQTIMMPLLIYAKDEKEHSFSDAVRNISDHYCLSIEERSELLPSASQEVIANRVGWARLYLKKAGLLSDPRRGFFMITIRGKEFLATNPRDLNTKILSQYSEFNDFREKKIDKPPGNDVLDSTHLKTPQEALEYGIASINENLADDLLKTILDCSPAFFEKLVVELLVKLGYGGSRAEAGQVIGKSGDEGIDGIIKEDKLGLDIIYIQAKKWKFIVGRPEIQKFVGALAGQSAEKGIFITTSRFTDDAKNYAKNVKHKLILIDGVRLTQLMIENNVGVSVTNVIEVKKIDSDYFIEE